MIEIFNLAIEGDFTYVDDIVEGVRAVMHVRRKKRMAKMDSVATIGFTISAKSPENLLNSWTFSSRS